MKALKQILKWVLITVLAFTSFNFFISSDYEFERSIEIDVPPHVVYEQVTNLKTWKDWAVWWKQDTTIATTHSGESAGKGARMDWVGADDMKGGLEIVECSLDSMRTDLDFGTMTTSGIWKFEVSENGTTVKWGMRGNMPFFYRFFTLFFEKMAAPDFENGLIGLKEYCEKIPSRSSDAEIVDWEEQTYISYNVECDFANIGQAIGEGFGVVFGHVQANNLIPLSSPFAIWGDMEHSMLENGNIQFEVGVMVNNAIGGEGINTGKTSSGKALQATHYGAYEMNGTTYNVLEKYAEENNLNISMDNSFEFYTNDPTLVAPEDVETLVVFEIQ